MQTKIAANAQALKRWLGKAEEVLGNHSDRLNAINIFPVADGDTGTNLYLTVRSASRAVAEMATSDVGELLAEAGRAAMEEARGNSGTLFSVFLAALAEPLHGTARLTGPLLAAALERAEIRCWSALSEPVAGTMLSAIEAATRAANTADAAQNGDDSNHGLAQTLNAAVQAVLEAVVATETQLDLLTEAHVVDAGAVGFLLVLDTLRASALGEELQPELLEGLHGYGVQDPHIHLDHRAEGMEVMCTINLSPLDAATLRLQLDELGESVILSAVTEVPDGYRWRVHVHVQDPEAALAAIRQFGEPAHLSVTALSAAAPDQEPAPETAADGACGALSADG
ncbi:DAK2 domain-containing protein [Arthrobacter mobilis]|uniref:DAK2 domain-containing protein n=1 Tax=Arthrobacter mobilis TaxID=2724944 RepID=A0A7X6HE27_9MICC|nr:DAK2 domain-containing protein [Arthrobacter mobilis]NKX55346.1 DAK2 domain-containing protein [Arthrobacter mobilis]